MVDTVKTDLQQQKLNKQQQKTQSLNQGPPKESMRVNRDTLNFWKQKINLYLSVGIPMWGYLLVKNNYFNGPYFVEVWILPAYQAVRPIILCTGADSSCLRGRISHAELVKTPSVQIKFVLGVLWELGNISLLRKFKKTAPTAFFYFLLASANLGTTLMCINSLLCCYQLAPRNLIGPFQMQ